MDENNELELLLASQKRLKIRLEKRVRLAEKNGVNVSPYKWNKMECNATPIQSRVYSEMIIVRDELRAIEKRLRKLSPHYIDEDAINKERVQIAAAEPEQHKAEIANVWSGDGINVEDVSTDTISGTTPSGKYFLIYKNKGTQRKSKHGYTLKIDGEVVFSSGALHKAYGRVKNT